MKKFDFSGWATRNNLKCSDGRTIIKDAFKDNNGQTVPLVWNHQHNDPLNVLGHALLENRDEGVYAYCKFNDTESGKNAKLLVEHGDVSALSIYANQLKQQGPSVLHGAIRELSLVLAGANPGAFIDAVMQHGEESDQEAIIYTGENIELYHASDDKPADDNLAVVKKEVPADAKKEAPKPEKEKDEETVADVFNTLDEKQKTVVYAMIGQALEEKEEPKDNNKTEDSKGGNNIMKHNVFDKDTQDKGTVLTHSQMETILTDAKKTGSLRDSVLEHAQDYGIENIDYLFPDDRNVTNTPIFIRRDTSWVGKFMAGIHHTPFSRIKSLLADITEDEARAKGYIKGKQKKEEVFTLLKRSTSPTTIYKKQKMDRDDVVDITDFDVVAWLKTEMRGMLDEEIARAALVGDGRSSASDDKINDQNIRPIWTDDDLYSIKAVVTPPTNATADQTAKVFIKAAVKSRKNYKGSGKPTLYTTEDVLTDCLLMEDNNGRVIYETEEKLATAMRVAEIVTVPVIENLTRVVGSNTHTLLGIIVNPTDYNIGADKGGAINMFDGFDIDYNQQKYLIETRCSGALVKPYSAIVLETVATTEQAVG